MMEIKILEVTKIQPINMVFKMPGIQFLFEQGISKRDWIKDRLERHKVSSNCSTIRQ